METSDELKSKVYKWSKNVGRQKALIKLISNGVGESMAQKLVLNNYKRSFTLDTAIKIMKAMASAKRKTNAAS